ncbi:MAG: hypothetical protein KF881_07625 [Acidobacteria bacterium]|nr:hypothetical protein [Acidobacteriota bacterium]
MSKCSPKVKDLIEARPFSSSSSTIGSPRTVVESYRFTPLTSDLMSSWLGRIAGFAPGEKAAFAIAGKRGVGKSHFLSLFAVLCSDASSRALLDDEHIRRNCEAFGGAEFKVVRVFRGSDDDLLKELRNAAEREFNTDLSSYTGIPDLLGELVKAGGDRIVALIIDSNPGREKRITRDDGGDLAAIADNAKALGIFVGIALDDDISGADGPNVELAEKFVIDYLDPQHLYQIVNSYVFPKLEGSRSELGRVYAGFKERFRAFRWSEERFASLYPLHPESLDIAPFVRFYVPDFALLGFASNAAVKIMGRPAESLIGLDEMFDAVETRLRAHVDLMPAFAVLDGIDKEILEQLPLTHRYPARLALKYLILRSLSGSPATPDEIEAGVLTDSGGTALDLEELLSNISRSKSAPIRQFTDPSGKRAYLLVGLEVEREEFEVPAAMPPAAVIEDQPNDHGKSILVELLHLAGWHFSDLDGKDLFSDGGALSVLEWQNTLRRGRISWHGNNNNALLGAERLDWQIIVLPKGAEVPTPSTEGVHVTGFWRLPSLSREESSDIEDYIRIAADEMSRSNNVDDVEIRKLRLSIERILTRVLVEDAEFEIRGKSSSFSEEDREKHTLAYLFSPLFDEDFSQLFVQHPPFGKRIGTKEFSTLVSKFLIGVEAESPEIQKLAKAIALPLGLAEEHGDLLKPSSLELLSRSPLTSSLISTIEASDDRSSISVLEDILYRQPTGLSLEARQLVITALVAAMDLEFVTVRGSRINSRSLDLQIVWDDIVAVARPLQSKHAHVELEEWCKRLASSDELAAGITPDIADCLRSWFGEWERRDLLTRLEAVPAESLTLSFWKKTEQVRRSLGRAASMVSAWIHSGASAEDCLSQFIDCFRGSLDDYSERCLDASEVETALVNAENIRSESAFFSFSFLTEDGSVEHLRSSAIRSGFGIVPDEPYRVLKEDLFGNFQMAYAENYVREHHIAKNDQKELRDVVAGAVGVDRWSIFVEAADLPWFPASDKMILSGIERALRRHWCDLTSESELAARPVCNCAFDPDLTPPISSSNIETFIARASERFVSNTIDELGAFAEDKLVATVRDSLISELSRGEAIDIEAESIEVLKDVVSLV